MSHCIIRCDGAGVGIIGHIVHQEFLLGLYVAFSATYNLLIANSNSLKFLDDVGNHTQWFIRDISPGAVLFRLLTAPTGHGLDALEWADNTGTLSFNRLNPMPSSPLSATIVCSITACVCDADKYESTTQ